MNNTQITKNDLFQTHGHRVVFFILNLVLLIMALIELHSRSTIYQFLGKSAGLLTILFFLGSLHLVSEPLKDRLNAAYFSTQGYTSHNQKMSLQAFGFAGMQSAVAGMLLSLSYLNTAKPELITFTDFLIGILGGVFILMFGMLSVDLDVPRGAVQKNFNERFNSGCILPHLLTAVISFTVFALFVWFIYL